MDLRLLFSNIELLLGVNEQLFSDLNERYHTWEAESVIFPFLFSFSFSEKSYLVWF